MLTTRGERASRAHHEPLHFRIGEVDVSLRSDVDAVADDFASLNEPFRRDSLDSREAIEMEVVSHRRFGCGPRRYAVRGDGLELGAACSAKELIPYLEWGINWRVIARRGDFLQLHAATLARDGVGVVFPAGSGSGKSTLAAGLLSRGWKYLSDEFALIDPRTLRVHAFPKAVCIKAGSLDVIRRIGLHPWQHKYYVKALKGCVGYIRPHVEAVRPVAASYPIRVIAFPKYLPGGQPRIRSLSRSRSAFALAQNVMNRDAFGDRTTTLLAQVVREAQCFALEAGPIEDTCDLVESLVETVRSEAGQAEPAAGGE